MDSPMQHEDSDLGSSLLPQGSCMPSLAAQLILLIEPPPRLQNEFMQRLA